MGSMALQLKPFSGGGVFEGYERAMSLRDLVDQRRYNALRRQEIEQKILEGEEERQQAQSLRQLFSTNPNPTTADVMRAAPGMLGIRWATEKRQLDKAQQDALEAAAKAQKENIEASLKRGLLLANKAEGYLWQPDQAERQRMYATDTPDLLRIGAITPEQAKSPLGDDTAIEAWVAQGKGRDYLTKLKGDIAEQTTKKAEAGRKAFDEQLKLFGRVLGFVQNPDQWQQVVSSAPPEIRLMLPQTVTAEELPQRLRQANLMTMTPEERQKVEPKTLAEWQRISLDPAYSPAEKKMADQMVAHLGRGQAAGTEGKLRDDYRSDKDVQNYIVRRDSMTEIQSAMLDKGGISDVKMIYNYIKMSDPGSVVKQDEKSMIENAGSLPARVKNLIPSLFQGYKLPDELRADILREAKKTYTQAVANYNRKVNHYREISERSGADPRNVLIDYSPATPGIQGPPTATPPQTGAAPRGGVMPNVTVEDVDRELRSLKPTGQPATGRAPVEEWEDGPDGRPRRKKQ